MKDKEKEEEQRRRKIRNLIIFCAFTAIILSISTYAWFIGMRTVNVSSFDVNIAATDDLKLSLNGLDWMDTVEISKATYNDPSVVYADNTNWWSGDGLIPMSSIGEVDKDVSRLKLFEKASLTATPGGYRLMASRVDNTGASEINGYVAFDLFIKNSSGRNYNKKLNFDDEEAIYLSTDSAAVVALTGGVAGTGIENSVRVAFAQIGRVIGTELDDDLITSMTCEVDDDDEDGDDDGITGICRDAQIWEPNDKAHVQSAINWYNKACKKRNAADLTLPASYDDIACTPLGSVTPTYAVGGPITAANRVDVYDGAEYNGWTGSAAYLTKFPYFTDTDKLKTGLDRPEFIFLAPNSITKVRIYVWIEGQDIDNYDFASIGKAISINFGFTKERFTDVDVDYEGPTLP